VTDWEQPARSLETSTVLRRLAWAAGIICLLADLAIISRAPIPWLDEVYLVSVANSVAHQSRPFERLTPRPEWVDGYEKIYGPVFFHVEAAFIRVLGLSPFSGRVVCWIGGVLTAIAAAWLVAIAGGSVQWVALAFALIVLTPEFSVIARNGRMDSLAIGFELAGMACLMTALRESTRATRWALGAGGCWALAVLTTPRTLPFLAGLLLAAPLLLAARETRASFVRAAVCLFAIVGISLFFWARHLDLTIVGWAWWLWDSLKDDAYNVVLPGHQRYWALGKFNAFTPFFVIVGSLALGGALLRRRAAPDGVHSKRRLIFCYLSLAVVFNALFYLVVANYPFGVSPYFVLPVLVVVLMATAVAGQLEPWAQQPMLAFWILATLFLGAINVVRYVEVWQTWHLRDPRLMQRFVERSVPPGSIVFGNDQYYFYAVQNAGSTFRTYNAGNLAIEKLKSAPPRQPTVFPSLDPAFLLWPVADPNAPFPSWFDCARAHVVATYESPAEAIGIERLLTFAFTPFAHGYPETILYGVPAGCPVNSR
jgi:4-amino-4-deoxy-L-arabinose transferase-like glycosyltransferase